MLVGTPPSSSLTRFAIGVLFLSSNQLSGSVEPLLYGLADTLEGLYLSDNEFEGTVPDYLCQFTSLGRSDSSYLEQRTTFLRA